KAHSMFGWDWGPKIPDLGLWRDIEIVAWNENRIEDVHIQQAHANEKVTLEIGVTLEKEVNQLETIVAIKDPNGQSISKEKVQNSQKTSVSILVEDPELWWPSGYGKQPLYTVEVSVAEGGLILDKWTKEIGLRTIEVKHEPDEWGKSFEFIINGFPIFMKGANYIPEDNLLPRTSKERTERLIKDSVAANFNMIR